MIRIKHSGDFKKTEQFFIRALRQSPIKILEKYGKAGVEALASATPKDTGKTASSWSYQIIQDEKGYSICWTNSNVEKHVNIALILQYGHGTRNGGYVQGIDYINPAIRPIFDEMANALWMEVNWK